MFVINLRLINKGTKKAEKIRGSCAFFFLDTYENLEGNDS